MRTPYVIVNITHRKIDWPVVVLARGDWDSGFVAAKNNRNKHCTVGLWVLRDLILVERH